MKNLKEILPEIYQLETSDPVGHGSSADVWKVKHKAWNKFLAVKVLSNIDAVDNIKNECDKWIRLGMHPNIVNCYYVKEIENIPCIFCEWCDNESLYEHINQTSDSLYPEDQAMQLERLLRIAIQIMLGLQYTHSVGGFCHGDVKPQNIMLTKDGQAKLTDFGCAGIKGVSGTQAYFSPEQRRLYEQDDSTLLTSATDVYSWAVTVLEMFMCGKSWKYGTEVLRILKQTPDIEMPDELRALLEECLSVHPVDRPDDKQILQQLGKIYSKYCNSDFYSNAENLILNTKYYETADFCNNRALSLIDMNQYDNAEKYFKKAIEISPHHSAATYNKAIFDWQCGKNDFNIVRSVVSSLKNPAVKQFAEQQCSTVKDFCLIQDFKAEDDIISIQFSLDSKAIMILYPNQERFCLEIESGTPIDPDSCQWDNMHHDATDRLGRHITETIGNEVSYFGESNGKTQTRIIPIESIRICSQYTFNKNGSLFAVAYDEPFDYEIDILEFDLGDDLGYWLCEIETFEELTEKYHKFNDLINRFEEISDISEKIALLTELEPLKDIGGDCLERYFKAKESLCYSCTRQNFRISTELFYLPFEEEITKIIMTEDAKYIMNINQYNDYAFLINTKSSKMESLDLNILWAGMSWIEQLSLTKDGKIQAIFSDKPDEPTEDEKTKGFSLTVSPESVFETRSWQFYRENFEDLDQFISQNKRSLIPEAPIPLSIKKECQEKNYTHLKINRNFTRLLAVTKTNEIIVYYLDYDLSI